MYIIWLIILHADVLREECAHELYSLCLMYVG